MINRVGERRKGIALVVVLGFLSILILMAVALITLTRTERLVSSYTSEGVRARQLARGALDRAMADLNNYFDTAKLVRLMPGDAVFISLGNGGTVGPNTGMFRGSETNWLPARYLVSPLPNYNVRQIWDTQAEWINIADPINTTSLLGRIAYAIVDCTGLYDVNVLGLKTMPAGVYVNQPTRKSIADVGLVQLPEAIGNAADLHYNRLGYHAFLSFREALIFNDGLKGRYSLDERSVFSTNVGIQTICPYSLSYDDGSWWDTVQWAWQKGGPGSAVPNVNEWTPGQAGAVFKQLLGVSDPIALQMAQALADYRDTNRVPQTTQGLTVEAVPMLNEIIVRGTVQAGGATIRIRVETWYPFPNKEPLSGYGFQAGRPTIASTLGGGDISVVIVKTGGGVQNYGVVTPSAVPAIGPISYNNGNPQAWDEIVYQVPLPGLTNGDTVRIGPRLERLQLYWNGVDLVDEAIGPQTFTPSPPTTVPGPFGPFSLQVDDPRLNHIAQNWTRKDPGNPGEINGAAIEAGCNVEGRDMYVRDGDLESVAELGFISIGQPWQTIALYSTGGKDLLARFRAAPAGTKSWLTEPMEWTNGMLNPNSHFPIWTNAFYGVNFAEVPDPPVTNEWQDSTQIRALVDSVGNMLNVTQFYAGADWAVTAAMQPGGALAVAGLNNNQREAIIRNSYRMFSPNGNLYSVFLVAQTFMDGNTNVISGEKRLVALVWHDPFRSSGTQRHRWFIRWLRWMEE